MLLHYFGSKEALIGEVMEHVQARLQTAFQALRDSTQGATGNQLLPKFWRALSDKRNQPFLRLLFEVQMLALQNPRRYRRYLGKTSRTWRHLIESALPAGRHRAPAATLYNAVVDGLLLELLSTGDLRRTTRALNLFSEQCGRRNG